MIHPFGPTILRPKPRTQLGAVILSFMLCSTSATANSNDNALWDISLEELGQIRVVSIASGSATPLDKAAGHHLGD